MTMASIAAKSKDFFVLVGHDCQMREPSVFSLSFCEAVCSYALPQVNAVFDTRQARDYTL